MSEFYHVSVLLDECIQALNIKPDGIYVDGPLGGAGHSSQIAARLTTGRLIGIDREPKALKAAGERLAPYADRVTRSPKGASRSPAALSALGSRSMPMSRPVVRRAAIWLECPAPPRVPST